MQSINVYKIYATIRWTTDASADSTVLYGTSPGFVTNQVSAVNNVTDHFVVLSGLTPSTQYYFDVTSTSGSNTTTDSNHGSHYTFTTEAASCSCP